MFKFTKYFFLFLGVLILVTGCSKTESTDSVVPIITPTITIDFKKRIDEFKPVNGINNGPKSHSNLSQNVIQWELDATQIYRDLDIPYVRTHDTEYPDGSGQFIDIHCIFPDMNRNPNDEKAYNFSATDEYIKNIQDSGAMVFYRLGESIAPSVDQATYQYPPKDYNKWAQICEHIIAHYNNGWNQGFKYNIQYWEIWNEPDTARQWVGEIEEYYKLYTITSRHLKKVFPDIKVGGGVLASANEENVKSFLDAIVEDGSETPLDFFSWHLYTKEPYRFIYRAYLVRHLLDEYGYENSETFCDEWNYVDDWENLQSTWEKIQSSDMAAFYAASLITLQNSEVDGAMYYDGSLTGEYATWCGLYNGKGETLPGYYGFWAFNQLKHSDYQSEVTYQREPEEFGIYVCAASGESDMVLLANTSDVTVRFQLSSNSDKGYADIFVLNQNYQTGFEETEQSFQNNTMIEMLPGEMQLITLHSLN